MQITEHSKDDVAVFTAQGRIDTEGAVELDRMLHAAVDAGKHKMVLDMAGVSYISSAGLRTLADILTRNREAGGDLKLVALSRKISRVLQIIGFDKFFTTFDSVDAAVKSY